MFFKNNLWNIITYEIQLFSFFSALTGANGVGFFYFFHLYGDVFSVFLFPELFVIIFLCVGFFIIVAALFQTYFFKVKIGPENFLPNFWVNIENKSSLTTLLLNLFMVVLIVNLVMFCKLMHVFSLLSPSSWIIYCSDMMFVSNIVLLAKITNTVFFFIFLIYLKNSVESYRPEIVLIVASAYVSSLVILSSFNFIMFFVSFEAFSMSVMGILTIANISNYSVYSAALQYYVINTIASVLALLGITLIFGSLGTFSFKCIIALTMFEMKSSFDYLVALNIQIALFLLFSSFIIKLGAIPYHVWLVGVYSRVHHAALLFVLVCSKFVFFWCVFILVYIVFRNNELSNFLVTLSIITLAVASISGMTQRSIKGFVIFCSLFNSGSLLFAISIPSEKGIVSFFTYLIFDNLFFLGMLGLLFPIFWAVSRDEQSNVNEEADITTLINIKDIRIKIVLSLFLLIFAGLPPFGVFFLKLAIIKAAVNFFNSVICVWLFLIFTAINAFNYIRVIKLLIFSGNYLLIDAGANSRSANIVNSRVVVYSENGMSFYLIFVILLLAVFFFFFEETLGVIINNIF